MLQRGAMGFHIVWDEYMSSFMDSCKLQQITNVSLTIGLIQHFSGRGVRKSKVFYRGWDGDP